MGDGAVVRQPRGKKLMTGLYVLVDIIYLEPKLTLVLIEKNLVLEDSRPKNRGQQTGSRYMGIS